MNRSSPPEIGDHGKRINDSIMAINYARAYFKDQVVQGQIDQQAKQTLAWMQKNTESYAPDGTLNHHKPWWPKVSYTDCEVLLETRRRLLRDRAYEHGILHFIHGLHDEKVIGCPDEKLIDLLVDAMTPVVLNQLMAYRYAKGAPDGVSLAQLSTLFGNGFGTSPTKIRHRIVGRLCPIGLFSARFNQGYEISVGAVGNTFYVYVYLPIINAMSINPEG